MVNDDNTLPPVDEGQPTIRSILLDNSNYLNDVVRTLEEKIVPHVASIKGTILRADNRAILNEKRTAFQQAETSAEAQRAANLDPQPAQAEPQTSFGGSKIGGGLAGLGAAGAGLGAFFLALAGAEAIMTKFGAGDNLKNLLTNVAEGLSAFSTKEFVALGTVLAAGAIFGSVGGAHEAIQAGVGIAAMGAGLAGFLISLSAADAVMSSFGGDGSTLSTLLGNIADGLSAFNNESMIALGTALGAGAGLGALFGIGTSAKTGFGIAAIGAGIAGFLAALSGADWAADKLGADGSNIGALLRNVGEGLSAFSGQGMIALGTALAAGAGLGALFPGALVGATVGIVAIGAGIAGFLAALSAADWVASKLGADGSNVSALLKNVGEALGSLSSQSFIALGSVMGVGGALGALFPSALPGATAGIVAIGVGIAGFLGALSAADWVAGKLGSQGENIGPLLSNIGKGLSEFQDLSAAQIVAIGPALGTLAIGLTALLGQQGLASIVGGGINALKGAWNWLTGNEDTVEKKGVIATLVDELEPLKNLDLEEVDKLEKFSSSLRNFASSINEIGNINVGDIEGNIAEIGQNISKALPVLRVMVKGGTIGDGFFDGYPEMNFGPEGEGGLLNPDLRMDELQQKAQQLRLIFDPSSSSINNTNNAQTNNTTNNALTNNTTNNALTDRYIGNQYPVPVNIVPGVATNQVSDSSMVINALSPEVTNPVNITNISNVGNNTDNSTTAIGSSGGSSVNVPAGRSYNMDQSFLRSQRPAYA